MVRLPRNWRRLQPLPREDRIRFEFIKHLKVELPRCPILMPSRDRSQALLTQHHWVICLLLYDARFRGAIGVFTSTKSPEQIIGSRLSLKTWQSPGSQEGKHRASCFTKMKEKF